MPVKPPSFRPSYLPAPEQRVRAYNRERGSARERGYTRKWERARKAYLDEHPLCIECEKQGDVTPATDVDHIIPHGGDQHLFWDQDNWQSLCHSHHSQKTRREGPGVGG